jgi:endonuclease-3 related protein
MISEQLTEIYKLLFDDFGPQHWWPGQGRFEIITGAILTQNTNWSNVEKAIANLKRAGCLDFEKLYNTPDEKIAEMIRPSGYFKVKTKRLRSFLNWLHENYNGRLEQLDNIDTNTLREQLLSINGIGPETADSILLYAFERPVFVVDTYTARVSVRHGLIEPPFDYAQLQEVFQNNLTEDVTLFNEYHALLVRCGKEFCKPKAKCSGCPLEKLPHTLEYEEEK